MNYNLAFANYIRDLDSTSLFDVDLNGLPLLDVIHKRIEVMRKNNPNFGKQYSSLILRLTEIENAYNLTIMPIHVTDIFWGLFISHMRNVSHLASSTIKTICSQLQASLAWASKHNAKVSSTYQDYKLPTIEGHQIALTADEVSWIYHYDISSIDRRPQHRRNLERVRDMFCLSCCLGQRYSDMKRVLPSCFDRNIFSIVQQKTGNRAKVDIDRYAIDKKMAYDILEKYDYYAPYCRHLSNYNKYLRELLQYIGMDDLIKIEEKINGEIKTSYIARYEMVCSHTARRTFATINVKRGYPIIDIRRCTGHKSENSFNKYICYGEDD